MIGSPRYYIWLILISCCCCISTAVVAQPKVIRKTNHDSPPKKSRKEERRSREYTEFNHLITIDVSRLVSVRFPSLSFTYQRHFGTRLGASGSLGLPINQIEIYKENSGSFSGIEARLGGKVFLSDYLRSRFYFAVEGSYLDNPVKAQTFVKETGKNSFRVRELKLNRKRQIFVPSFGYQMITLSGVFLEAQAGITSGRRGIFSENGVEYLDERLGNFFGSLSASQNEWDEYIDMQLRLGLGYTF